MDNTKIIKKTSYCLEILYDKFSPFIISAILVVYHILCFLFPYNLTWIEYVCLPSAFTILHMYNLRSAFMFCKVHRCFVNYIACNVLACMATHYWINPYRNIPWIIFIIVGTIIATVIGVIYYKKEHSSSINIKKERGIQNII